MRRKEGTGEGRKEKGKGGKERRQLVLRDGGNSPMDRGGAGGNLSRAFSTEGPARPPWSPSSPTVISVSHRLMRESCAGKSQRSTGEGRERDDTRACTQATHQHQSQTSTGLSPGVSPPPLSGLLSPPSPLNVHAPIRNGPPSPCPLSAHPLHHGIPECVPFHLPYPLISPLSPRLPLWAPSLLSNVLLSITAPLSAHPSPT